MRNRFGHLHPRTLATLAAHRIPVALTDRVALISETDGHATWVTRP